MISELGLTCDLPTVAYFSMEVGIEPAMPTYSGGLGILAGDFLRAAADTGLYMVGVTLLHRKGYFRQKLDQYGNQKESPVEWKPESFLELMPAKTSVFIEGRSVWVRAWRYTINGANSHKVPIFFLDTFSPENGKWDQTLTDYLYGGDDHYRLCQEVVLGMGGVGILRTLGYNNLQAYHMNEGHAALLILALLEERLKGEKRKLNPDDIEYVKKRCVFTTHTPVPSAIDKFPMEMVQGVFGDEHVSNLASGGCLHDDTLNMIYMALCLSRYINGVSMRHEEISRDIFPNYPINSITNGVHALTWTAEPFVKLFDRHVPEWRQDNLYLRYVISVPLDEIQRAHAQCKQSLLAEIDRRINIKLSSSAITIGFARRATEYKRADFLFSDIERLKQISQRTGPIQVIYGGKAHPRDQRGKEIIKKIFEAGKALQGYVTVVYLEDYDMQLAKYLCSGVDIWLNTPKKPEEASGTSGMKAALNGVPSLSILDGWWAEGHVEGVTGWSIGEDWFPESDPKQEIAELYNKLEYVICPMFCSRPMAFAEIMRSAIALNGSYYNAQRMVFQYIKNAYSIQDNSQPKQNKF